VLRLRRRALVAVREMIHEQWGAGASESGAEGGPVQAQLTGSAEVKGETTVKVEVTVTPTGELINAAATAKPTPRCGAC
jgi:hypothetical protein